MKLRDVLDAADTVPVVAHRRPTSFEEAIGAYLVGRKVSLFAGIADASDFEAEARVAQADVLDKLADATGAKKTGAQLERRAERGQSEAQLLATLASYFRGWEEKLLPTLEQLERDAMAAILAKKDMRTAKATIAEIGALRRFLQNTDQQGRRAQRSLHEQHLKAVS